MRILHLLQSPNLNGAENVAADICMMFQLEHEMIYCSPDGRIRKSLSDRNIEFYPLPSFTLHHVINAINYIKPDLIHAHDVRATILAMLAAKNVPYISQLHVNNKNMSRFTLKSVLYFFATIKASKVIFVSESCFSGYFFKELVRNKSLCLQNIIYLPRMEKLLEKDSAHYNFDFIYMGRISDQKDPIRVAHVASKVLQLCPNAKFGVIGDGPLKSEMGSIFKKEGTHERVTFTGRLEYPYKVLKGAKCMVMCSKFEGTPIAVLEAMSLGIPIVSTPVDGINELLGDERVNLLSDNDDELVQKIIAIINNSEIYERLSVQVKMIFEKVNSQDNYHRVLQKIYSASLGV